MIEGNEADLDWLLGKIQNASRKNDFETMKEETEVLIDSIKVWAAEEKE